MLEKGNQAWFAPLGLRAQLLKDCQSAIPVLAQWMFEEWHPYDSSLTKEKLFGSFQKRLNDDKIPFTIVALRGERPVGMISLKDQAEAELSDFPKEVPWLGSLHVAPEERKKGIGSALFKVGAAIAGSLGHPKLFFYTSNPENLNWYQKRGAQMEGKRPFRGHEITILHIDTKPIM